MTSEPASPERPPSYWIWARFGGRIGRGRMTILPGRITINRKRPADASEYVHQSPEVEMLKTRLTVPWVNTHFILRDGQRAAVATVPSWTGKTIARDLRAAGFSLKERTSWWTWVGWEWRM